MPTRLPRPLDLVEIRVLGSLLEKEQTTPESYPLTLNSLLAACNQKTNREPVMELGPAEVGAALERLRLDVLVWRTESARSQRWKQSVERRWELDPPTKALLTLLMLRGPQTSGELRARAERMHRFADVSEVEPVLRRLAAGDEPLVAELTRRPGHKESRWIHRVGTTRPTAVAAEPGAAGRVAAGQVTAGQVAAGQVAAGQVAAGQVTAEAPPPAVSTPAGPDALPPASALSSLAARLDRLEAQVATLAAEIAALERNR